MPSGFPRIGRKTALLLVVAGAATALAIAWDWNWFRHPVERYFRERSHRDVRIGDLDISITRSLEPTVRLRGLYVQNAPWADDRPFVTAQEVAFTFALRSIRERRPVVSRLVLVDADVDLERQADGHRNWRLRNPENVGPGRLKVIRLDARNTRIRFIRRDTDFEVVASAMPLEPASRNAGADLARRVLFEGRLEGARFAGSADTGAVLTIMETGAVFPIRGYVQAGNARMDFDGSLADLFNPSKAVGKVRLKGDSLVDLHPFTRIRLPDSRPFDLHAQLDQEGDALSIQELRVTLGSTRLAGAASLDRTLDPPLLKAALRSEAANLDDLLHPKARRRPPPATRPDKAGDRPARLFSTRALHLDALRKFDAELRLQLKKLTSRDFPALESFSAVAQVSDGVMQLEPAIGLADGTLRGRATVDARQKPARVDLKLDGRDLRIEQLLAGRIFSGRIAGPFEVHVDVKARGDSAAVLAANLDGRMAWHMRNGVISNLADAVLQLDPAKAVRALITGRSAIAVNRIDVEFDFRDGRGSARNIFIDTGEARVVGTGKVDLRDETLDVVLTPRSGTRSILALDSSIGMRGPIRKPTLELVRRQAQGAEP